MKYSIHILLITWAVIAQAQGDFNVAYLRSSTQIQEDRVNDFEFSFTYADSIKANGDMWIASLNYIQFDVVNSDFKPVSLSNNSLRLGYIKQEEKSKTMLMLIPKYNGGNGLYNFQMGGILRYERLLKDNFSWSIGGLYNTDMFGHFLLPFVGLKWKVSDKLWIYGDIPIYAHVRYDLGKHSKLGLQFRGIISSHPFGKEQYYETSQDWICAYIDLYLSKHIVIQPSIGYFFIRNLNYYDRSEKLDAKLAIVNFGSRNEYQSHVVHGITPFVGVHLFYRVKTH